MMWIWFQYVQWLWRFSTSNVNGCLIEQIRTHLLYRDVCAGVCAKGIWRRDFIVCVMFRKGDRGKREWFPISSHRNKCMRFWRSANRVIYKYLYFVTFSLLLYEANCFRTSKMNKQIILCESIFWRNCRLFNWINYINRRNSLWFIN